jgi:hypothetical protein
MKTLIAEKCEDGWYVKVIKTHHLSSKADVLRLIRQEGLRLQASFTEETVSKIFAD